MSIAYKKIKYITLFAVLIGHTVPAEATFSFDSISSFFSRNKYIYCGAYILCGALIGVCIRLALLHRTLPNTSPRELINLTISRNIPLTIAEQRIFNELTAVSKIPKSIGIPDFIAKRCFEPIGFLPNHIQEIAQEAMKALGLSNIFFFHTNYRSSYASSQCFPLIGLRNNGNQFEILHPERELPYFLLKDGRKLINTDIIERARFNLLRTIYHELIHIRSRLSLSFVSSNYKKITEMEAELGGTYYLAVLNNVGLRYYKHYSCEDDGEHPVHEEQSRYNDELLRRLYINDQQLLKEARKDPNGCFTTIVSPLVEQYTEERRTGILVQFPKVTGLERVELICGVPTQKSSQLDSAAPASSYSY